MTTKKQNRNKKNNQKHRIKSRKGRGILDHNPHEYFSILSVARDPKNRLNALPEDIQHNIINLSLMPKREAKLKEAFVRKILINHIKELCNNRVFYFFDILNNMKTQLIDYTEHITLDNFVQHKNNVLIPMFNKISQKLEPKRSENSKQYVIEDSSRIPVYSAPPSVEAAELDKFINMFNNTELATIYKFFYGYFLGEIPFSYKIPVEDPHEYPYMDSNRLVRNIDSWIQDNYRDTHVAGRNTRVKKKKHKKSRNKKKIMLL